MMVLVSSVVLGCTDSTAANYNPLANIDDSHCSMCEVIM